MQVYTVIRKGEFHPVFCEDFLITEEIGSKFFLAAVMDGCSSGKDSHFASALFGKILHKIAKTLHFQETKLEEQSVEYLMKKILRSFMDELKLARNYLMMDMLEALATLIILLYDNQKAYIVVLGDGFVALDGQIHEIDQDNRPDYPAYHLKEDFEIWYESQSNIFEIENPKEISISTDGIDTFQTNNPNLPEGFDPMHFLLIDESFIKNHNMLNRKCNILEKKYGFKPGDDVAIIRMRFHTEEANPNTQENQTL